MVRGEPNAPGAVARCVVVALGGSEDGDQLGNAGGAAFDVLEEPAELGKGVVDSFP